MRYQAIVTTICALGFLVACGPGEDENNDTNGVDNDNTNQEEAGTFFQPDSAEASSEWSNSYLIDYVIDGSGLPDDFGPSDPHEEYSSGQSHWTTEDGDVEGAWATFTFDDPVTIDTFWMWNHRSTSPPAYSEGYGVTLFDLEFLDADGESIDELTDLVAEGGMENAQEFTFDQMDDVSSVLLTIQENDGEPEVTGLAEVGFGLSE